MVSQTLKAVCVCACAHISVLMDVGVVSLMEAICEVYRCAEDKCTTFQWVERLTDYVCSLSAKFKKLLLCRNGYVLRSSHKQLKLQKPCLWWFLFLIMLIIHSII